MKVACYTTHDIFDLLYDDWNALLAKSNLNLIFLTWEWQSIWWRAYEPGQLWLLAIYDDDDVLMGIAPWFIQTTPDNERVLRTIGCVDVTDYLGLIVSAEAENDVISALSDYLFTHQDQLDRIDLCNIPEYASILTTLALSLEQNGAQVLIKEQEVCPVIALPNNFADYVQALDKKDRHELKRKMRKAEGSEESLDWFVVDDSYDLNVAIDDFLRLMGSSSADKLAFLADFRNVAFFKAIVPALYALGYVQMAFIKANDDLVAAYLNFLYQDEVLVYNSGLDVSAIEGFSPGIVLLAYLIRHAIEQGYRRFDFLRGNETYKYRMGGKDIRVMNLIAHFQPQLA